MRGWESAGREGECVHTFPPSHPLTLLGASLVPDVSRRDALTVRLRMGYLASAGSAAGQLQAAIQQPLVLRRAAPPWGARAREIRLCRVKEDTVLAGSLQAARRVLRRERDAGSSENSPPTASELQRACHRVTENLRDTMGADGCTALFARALARTETAHPALKSIRRITKADIGLDDVARSVDAHGIAAVTGALEAFFAALIDVLGRLIGEDMALRIVLLPDLPPDRRHEGDPS